MMTHITLLVVMLSLCLAALSPNAAAGDTRDEYRRLAEEMDRHLDREILAPWYPRAIDTQHGGFIENYDEQWRPTGSQTQRSIVYQSRLTWVAAEVATRYPNRAARYKAYALHGASALAGLLWDKGQGGFYWQVDAATGKPTVATGEKHVYGISFGIYAAAAAYLATKDAAALDLAKRAFSWLDEHAHDARNGGYFEALTREGKPILTAEVGRRDFIGTTYGQKSMNTHIHLLEAFTELHRAWPDARVTRRLQEVFKIVRDKVYGEPGYLRMFFKPDWQPTSDEDSFGHDIETAYLLQEAAKELGTPQDPAALRASRRLVDHALRVGWDEKQGGFYDHGAPAGPATGLDKVWWTQAEGLNALLLMHERHGSGQPKYLTAFRKQWAFIRDHQVDRQYHGWITSVGADGGVRPGQSKSDMWKDPYHQGRAVMNVVARLRKLAGR